MAKEKEAYYFSHDSNARNDPKIGAMRCVYGSEGYGWYWMLIEMMREQSGYKLDMQSKYAYRAMALQLQSEADAIKKFIQDCINEFQLFDSDDEFFWSNSLVRRMEKKEEKSEKYSKNARKRWEKVDSDAIALQSHSNGNALKESKVKEIKEKESKEEEIENSSTASSETNPLLDLIDSFCKLHHKGDWQLKSNERGAMNQLLSTGIPLTFITTTMNKIYAQRTSQGERITSFTYYFEAIKDAWKARESNEKHRGIPEGVQSGRDATKSGEDSITGGRTGWIAKERVQNRKMPEMPG